MPRFPLPDKFTDGDFERFAKSFERIAKANGWSEDEKMTCLPLCLQGRALIAFEKHEKSCKSLTEAFKVLAAEFSGALDKDSAMKEFNSCSWGAGLDIDVYAQNLLRLSIQGLPSLGDDDRYRLVVKQFLEGFPADVRGKLRLIFSGRAPTLTEAVSAAKDIINDQATASTNCASLNECSMEKKYNELLEKLQAVAAEVASISSERTQQFKGTSYRANRRSPTRRPTAGIRCFNCSGIGHIARQCPSSRIDRRSRLSGNGATAGRGLTSDPQ